MGSRPRLRKVLYYSQIKLIQILSEKIKERDVISLIHKFLKVRIMILGIDQIKKQ